MTDVRVTEMVPLKCKFEGKSSISIRKGEIFAILGHSDSEKKALLLAFAGQNPSSVGSASINGSALECGDWSTEVALVPEQPLFLPTLTVKETLEYAGGFRIPTSLPVEEKERRVKQAERLTGIHDIGKKPVQLISKFHRTCLGIACEMLQGTDILVIEEPFAGLSCSEGLKMTSLLTSLCKEANKAIIVSMSTPVSHLINKCSSIVFLHQDRVIYKSTPDRLEYCLTSAGSPPPLCVTPSEHLMGILATDSEFSEDQQNVLNKLTTVDCGTEEVDSFTNGQSLIFCNGHDLAEIKVHGDNHALLSRTNSEQSKPMKSPCLAFTGCRTPYWNQIKILTSRNWHNAKRRILFPVSVCQNVYILVICVLIWWQPERTEETIKDRLGLFFFTVVQWAFFSLLDAILTFPKELRVILQERSNKLYQTSAFCISKTLTEVPLAIIQPCVYLAVIYWVANLNNVTAFYGSLLVLIVDVIVAQSVGLFVGAALNPPWTVSVVSLGLLSMMLWGGAFCTPPIWLRWGKYASYFTYGLNALIALEFRDAEPIRCGVDSMVPMCNTTVPDTNQTITHFPSEVVLLAQNITWSVTDNIMVLLGIGIVTKTMWYFVIRLK